MGLKRVSWVRSIQGQCRALRPLGHQGCRLRNQNKDQPLCSGYTSSDQMEDFQVCLRYCSRSWRSIPSAFRYNSRRSS